MCRALALWALTRRGSVSSPLRTIHALKGERVMPAVRTMGKKAVFASSSLQHSAPAMTRPWPSRNFVPEWMTMSAPSAMGRCNTGVRKLLSTASSAPALWAMLASAAMSHRSVRGLVGVSANSRRVLGRMAACQSLVRVWATKLACTPNRAMMLPSRLMVLPNMDCEQTMWSPALSSPMHSASMADMPLAVATVAGACSSALRRCSKLLTVGLPVRE